MSNDTATLEARAFNNIVTLPRRTEPVDVEVIEDPTTLSVGDFVWAFGRGNWRQAVVVKVGAKNATAIYTTEGSITQVQQTDEYIAQAYARRETIAAAEADQAVKNLHYTESMADGTAEHYTRFAEQCQGERLAASMAENQARLDAMASTDPEVVRSNQHAKTIERITARFEAERAPMAERVTYTNVTLKPGKARRVA